MNDLLGQLGITGVYEGMTRKSSTHYTVDGLTKDVKVRNHARILQCADPHHADEHPSFLVNERTNRYACLSRGQKGNMLDLVRLVSGRADASNGELMSILREAAGARGTLVLQPAPDSRFASGKWIKLEDERITGIFDYRDAKNTLIYQVYRYEGTHNGKRAKRFSQRRPLPENGSWTVERGEWVFRADNTIRARMSLNRADGNPRTEPRYRTAYDLDGVTPIPYRLRELLEDCAAGRTIFIVEGEVHVDLLRALGFAATTNSGGTGFTYPLEWAKYFIGAPAVYIIPDCDETGRFAAAERSLHLQTAAPIVTALDVWPWRTDKFDVVDFVREMPRMNQRQRGNALQDTLDKAIIARDSSWPLCGRIVRAA